MAGSRNNTQYSAGYNILPTTSNETVTLQLESTATALYNISGNPEGLIMANVGTLALDRTGGDLYQKKTGTMATGWAIVGGGSSAFDPSTTVYQYDDFIGNTQSFWQRGEGGGGSFVNNFVVTNGHPGTVDLVLAATGSASTWLATKASGYNPVLLGGGDCSIFWCVQIPTLSDNTNNRFNTYSGFIDNEGSESDNGVYFSYTDNVNSGRWECVTASGGSRTRTDSGVTVTTSFFSLKAVINAAASSVDFYINGTLVATNTTNIPTSNACGPGSSIINNGVANTSPVYRLDCMYFTQTLTVAR